MRTLSNSLAMTLAGAAALFAVVGCKSSSGGQNPDGNSGIDTRYTALPLEQP